MYQLPQEATDFPDPSNLATCLDLPFCIGGKLNADMVAKAYQKGIFPWYNEGEEIQWWCPDPRFVLYPQELRVSKSMSSLLAKEYFTITVNSAFDEVIHACRRIKRKGQQGTWITDEITKAYTELHTQGIATSVEAWHHGELVGGFYGIDLGHVFCGESMFAKMSNASKAAFITFVQEHRHRLKLIDCQVYTDHLASLGAREIRKSDFLAML